MQDYTNPYASPYSVAAQPVDARAQFIRKTYAHLAAAIAAFAIIEYILFQIPGVENFAFKMTQGFSWLIVMGAFMGVSMLANKWALSNTSKSTQYMGLGIYVVAQAVIMLPLLIVAARYAPVAEGSQLATFGLIGSAGIITAAMVAGISFVAFTTKKDFSFLGGILKVGGFIAIAVIILSIVMGFTLGLLFSAIMVLFAAASVLYSTSNIIHQYNTNQYVAASLGLFASIALLFWYVLQVLMSLSSSD